MCVQTKTMPLVYLALNLLMLLVSCLGVNSFRYNKPIIYLNLFDELTKDNVSSTKHVEKGISTERTLSSNTANAISHSNNTANDITHSNTTAKVIKKRLDFMAELPKLNDENKTSSTSYDEMFEFDIPYKADITEHSVNESDTRIHNPTAGFSDPMEYEFLEPELTRLFFMKAIANIIENIIATLFAVEEPLKPVKPDLNNAKDLDYNSAPSRNMIKRAVPIDGAVTKLQKEIDHTISSGASFETVPSNISEMKNIEPSVSPQINENSTEHITEGTDSTSGDFVSDPLSPHSSDKVKFNKSQARESEVTAIASALVKEKVLQQGISISHKNSEVKPISGDEGIKMSHFSDESAIGLLNDEMVNQKDSYLYKGIHLVKRHDGVAKHSENEKSSGAIVTALMVGTTALIVLLLGALGLAAGYLYLKRHDPENQIATNLQSAVA